MTAAQHAIVWNNVADRCKRLAEEASKVEAFKAETVQLGFSVFAATIANAYQDCATVFKQ